MRRLLANLCIAIASRISGTNIEKTLKSAQDLILRQRARIYALETAHSRLVLQYFNDDTNPRFDVEADWTPDDAAAFAAFLKSQIGQAFQARLRAVAAQVAICGCKDVIHTAHSAGTAYGWSEALEYIVKLSRVSRVPDTKSEEAPEGEEQLLERWSP